MGKLKIILGGGLILIVGLIVAAVAILQSTDFNQYKGQISDAVKDATGRELVIAGDLSLDISLSPKVSVDGVTLSNAEWGSRPEMVKLKSFAAQMQLLPLLFGDIQIDEIILIEPDILIETDAKGQGNWVMGPATPAEEEPKEADQSSGSAALPAVNSIRIEKANFTYKDGQKGEETSIVIDLMEAKANSIDDPLNLLFSGTYNGHLIELTGQLGSPEALMNQEELNINLLLKAADATVTLTGSIKEPVAAKGLNLALTAKSDNISKVAEIAGAKVGKVGPFDLAATISDIEGGYKVGGINLKIAETDLSGDVTANIAGAKPYINVALSSNRFNVSDVTPQSTEGEAAPAPAADTKKESGGKLFPKDPLPLEGLQAVNADVSFKATKMIAADFALNNFSKVVSLKDGQVSVKPGFDMGGGKFGGEVKLDGRKLPARLNINLKGTDLGLGDSLKETGVTDLIDGGKTQVNITLNTTGSSVAALMAGLKGKTLIDVGEGKINSKFVNLAGGDLVNQLAGALNPFAEKQDFTPLACMVVNLDFDKGVTDYDKRIAIQTDKMNVTSSGEIDLAKETLDIGVKPEPRGDAADLGINAGGLASMVRLQGPLSAPGVGIDALGTAKAAAGIAGAIATGGVSLLVSGLADKALADSDPCATALGKKSSQPAKSEPAQKTEEKSEPANPVGGLLNMFGR